MASPRLRAAPGMGTALGTAGGAAAVAWLAGLSALPLVLEDLRHDSLLGVEELRVDVVPPAELGDVEQVRGGRELVRAWGVLDDRAVALAHEDLLGGGRVEEVHEALRQLRILGVARGGDRVLDQDRLVRDDVVEVLALLLGQD